MSRNGAIALGYARRGWPVLPIHQPTRHGCSCRHDDCASPAKHPKISGGLTNASADPAAVRTWWRQWPAANIGIRTGRPSGLVVVDIDPAHGGADTLATLQGLHGDLGGWRIETGSGGEHRWFAHPQVLIRNSAGRLGDGIDIRCDGGYVIAPPSTHICGGDYRWVDARGPLPDLPAWLAERLVEPPRPAPARLERRGPVDRSSWALAAQVMETDQVRQASDGQRNATLNRAAFCLGQIAGAGLLDQHTVTESLVDAAVQVGLGEREARRTIASGLRAGMARPRAPSDTTDRSAPLREPAATAVEVEL